MSHIVLTQIKEEVKSPILIKSSEISYSNPATENEGTYINLKSGTSIRVVEDALLIQELIKEDDSTWV